MKKRRRKPAIKGFIFYDGPSFLDGKPIIAVGTLKTGNIKTGNMVQVWIIPKDKNPVEAVVSKDNVSVCGNCPLQGNGCYVLTAQAPLQVWKTYHNGGYTKYVPSIHRFLLANRYIRLGAYGDPAAMPVAILETLATSGRGWTGYSHQLFWIDQQRAEAIAKLCMVSAQTKAQAAEAERRGWRYFLAIQPEQSPPEDSVRCPYDSHGIQCNQCGLCKGTAIGAKSVWILAHGRSKKRVGQNA